MDNFPPKKASLNRAHTNMGRVFSLLREKNALRRHLGALNRELGRLDTLSRLYKENNTSRYNTRYRQRVEDIRFQASHYSEAILRELNGIEQELQRFNPDILRQVTDTMLDTNVMNHTGPTFIKFAINRLNSNYKEHKDEQEKQRRVISLNKPFGSRGDLSETQGLTFSRPGPYQGQPKRKNAADPQRTYGANSAVPTRRTIFDTKSIAHNYQISTAFNTPSQDAVAEELEEAEVTNNADASTISFHEEQNLANHSNHGNRNSIYTAASENTRSRYNDWTMCAEYLRNFKGITLGNEGQIGVEHNLQVPPDFSDLPITLICYEYLLDKIRYILAKIKMAENLDLPDYHIMKTIVKIPEKLPSKLETLALGETSGSLPTLPETLQTLFLYKFNGKLPRLPEGLQTLFLYTLTQSLPDSFPSRLQNLHLGSFNRILPPFPSGLLALNLGSFTGNFPPLPPGLLALHLGSFNSILPTLPAGLQRLSLGLFNQSLPDPLPPHLVSLNLQFFKFNLPQLPVGLRTLVLNSFNNSLPPLPEGLHTLTLKKFTGRLPNHLPTGLQRLELTSFNGTLHSLPPGLQTLSLFAFNGTLPPLPAGLQTLSLHAFEGAFSSPLPAGLITLSLHSFNGNLPPLPAGLQKLQLNKYTGILPNALPAGLVSLDLYSFNGPLPSLPPGLQVLVLHAFKGTLPALPPGLQILKLGSYNGILPTPLPSQLRTLDLPSFNGSLPNPLPIYLKSYTTKRGAFYR